MSTPIYTLITAGFITATVAWVIYCFKRDISVDLGDHVEATGEENVPAEEPTRMEAPDHPWSWDCDNDLKDVQWTEAPTLSTWNGSVPSLLSTTTIDGERMTHALVGTRRFSLRWTPECRSASSRERQASNVG